ncbi:MAG: flagellar motor switch phosphatase FliY [Limnochordia bacterium]|jgi:flagellar motor switch protein FliN/FliY
MVDDLLSQEEIDQLLGGVSEGEQPVELSDLERDTLAEIGNISMGSAATALSTLVGKRVRITVPSVELTTTAQVQAAFPTPCVIVTVEFTAGLKGKNIFIVNDSDALVIAGLMMGEDPPDLSAELDELRLSAVAEAMNQMMGSAATAMSELFRDTIDLTPPKTKHQLLAETQKDMPLDESVVTVSFRIEIEGLVDSEMVQVIEAPFALEMARRLLTPAQSMAETLEDEPKPAAPTPPPTPVAAAAPQWEQVPVAQGAQVHDNISIDLIKHIPVQIRAVLGRTRISIANILKLGPGHVLELDTLDGEPIDILVNNTPVARGEVVVVGEQFGVRITEIASTTDRIKTLE